MKQWTSKWGQVNGPGHFDPAVQDWGKYSGGGIVLVDDDSRIGPGVDVFNDAESKMTENPASYALVPVRPGSGNSNSWARELLERAGLLDEYEKAMKKRRKAGHEDPWIPGWSNDPWGE